MLLTRLVVRVVHFIMQRKQLLGIAERAEMAMPHVSAFKTPEGEAAYLAAYDAAMKRWPVPYEEFEIASRFGMTHVVVSGPKDAPPLVLLHAFMVSLTMWSRNIADFSKNFRVYAVDVMGQPSKSTPNQPIRSRAEFVEWLTAVLDALKIDRTYLAGYSYGGWLTLNYAIGAPERLKRIAVLSPAGSFLRNGTWFFLRGVPVMFFPKRVLVESFVRWLTFGESLRDPDLRHLNDCLVDQMYLGSKHFRMPPETLRVGPVPFSDNELRALQTPTLLLIGQHEVLYDAAAALDRATRLMPHCQGELVPRASHDMPYSQYRIVDARVVDFLKRREDEQAATERRSVA